MSKLQSEVGRMRQRLTRIDQQVRKTRLQFSDGITVSNSTGRSLNLTLNISERQKYPKDVDLETQEVTLNSNFKLPNNSVVTHHFTLNGKDCFNPVYSISNYQSTKKRQMFPSPSRNHQREEQKFRSTGSWKHFGDGVDENGRQSFEKKSSDNRIKIEEQDCSDIEQQSRARPITHQSFEKKAADQHKQEIKQQKLPYEPHNNINNKSIYTQSSIKMEPIEQSPQVYSYLHQQFRNHHPEINTSLKKQTQIQTQYQEKIDTPLKNKSKQPINTHSHSSKLSDMLATSNRVSLKKMFESQHINSVNLDKNGSTSKKQNWSVMAIQHLKSNNKHELSNQNKPKAKAEQLYKQRKQKLPAKTFAKDESRYKKDVDRRFNRFVTVTRASNQHSLSKRSLSPKIEAITDRLSSRQKSPCGHYRLYSESKQRESFNLLIDQNPIARKYICKEQRQQLFQLLRNDSQSVSLWPMKIVNYTYSKLKKSCQVNYDILEV